jgi:hypothetical protein
MFTARDVLWQARTTLQDGDQTRWTLEELRVHLNTGLDAITFYKPTAVSKTEILDLDEGTLQSLDEGVNMLRVIRNITSIADATPRVAGPIVTVIDKAILDVQFPGWHETAVVPFSSTVRHVVFDEMNPRSFYVYPGNDGTGRLECILAVKPTHIDAPTDPLDIDEYTAEIDLPPIYINVLVDWVLHKAFQKDSAIPGAANRSVAHLNSFMQALGGRQAVEQAANVTTD